MFLLALACISRDKNDDAVLLLLFSEDGFTFFVVPSRRHARMFLGLQQRGDRAGHRAERPTQRTTTALEHGGVLLGGLGLLVSSSRPGTVRKTSPGKTDAILFFWRSAFVLLIAVTRTLPLLVCSYISLKKTLLIVDL